MEETPQQIDLHNVRQLVDEIDLRFESVVHEISQLRGLIDDLAVYLPQPDAE